MEQERKRGWESHWKDLAAHFMPRRARFLSAGEETNRGDRRNHLFDDVGILARRTLSSGMQSGLTSPARPWFSLTLQDEELVKLEPVKQWLHAAYERMVNVFGRSNFYDQVHLLYDELGTFGTGVLLVEEDEKSIIRNRTLTVGEYCLDVNSAGRVDTLYRRLRMTARQIKEAWPAKCPERVERLAEHDSSEWLTVLHAVEPNPGFDPERRDGAARPFRSVYMLFDGDEVLEESGYYEFPALCPRWNTTASDIYGSSPAMDALADCRLLQKVTEDGLFALEKEVNPPLLALQGAGLTQLDISPGKLTFVNALAMGGGQAAVQPLYQVRANLSAVEQIKAQLKQQIREMFFNNLFLMLTGIDKQMTATEVAERNAEKMLMLGPVLDRLRSELFQPLIERVFGIMWRKSLIPPPPDEMSRSEQEIKIEFISILAQAQKQAGIAAINNTVAFVGQVAQMSPEALDKLNVDEAVEQVAEMNGVPPKLLRSEEEVMQIRQARAQQQQQMQMMAMLGQGADIAQKGAGAIGALNLSGPDAGAAGEQATDPGGL